MGEISMTFIILLALLGFVLVYSEFYFPSGILGIIAAASLIGSATWFGYLWYGIHWTIVYALLLIAGVLLVSQIAIRRVRKKIALNVDQQEHIASTFDVNLVGKTATVLTDLKPTGHVVIDGKQYQALSETGYLPKDTPVIIVGGRGAYLIVKKKGNV
jgi:membrane-bound serine protease (ClpP class)